MRGTVLRSSQSVRAAFRTAVFFLKVLPMLPSGAIDRLTPPPVVERLSYPTRDGLAEGDLYRPATPGPHPGLVVCLGVVPFGVDHPQVPRLGEALARSGFAALLYWSPAMRDQRLDPVDIDNIALAYDRLLEHPAIDPARSGLLGTCVGASFALMAAAHPLIRERVHFVGAFAPYASMQSLAVAIASATRSTRDGPQPWAVDPLTRAVYERTMSALLEGDESTLSLPLLGSLTPEAAAIALRHLPVAIQERLARLSPLTCLADIYAPLIMIGHDRDDTVIPVDESRQLVAAFSGRAGVHYTEFGMFQHADPTKRKLPLPRLVSELSKFYRFVYPMYRQVA
jgi:dienelactone hydrolase